jgi:hypothetical protein
MKSLIVVVLIAVTAIPAVAFAAAKSGKYSGVSSAKYVQVGSATEPTDKGKVTFTVKSNKVLNFKMRDQLMNCGPAAEIDVDVKSIKLNSRGKGSKTYQDPTMGTLKVSIAVTSKGTASGTIGKPSSATGLCNPDNPARFKAKAT